MGITKVGPISQAIKELGAERRRAMEFDRNTKSYATMEALERKLFLEGFQDHRHLIAYTKEGRITAVFPQSNIQDGDLMRYARHGFMTLG